MKSPESEASESGSVSGLSDTEITAFLEELQETFSREDIDGVMELANLPLPLSYLGGNRLLEQQAAVREERAAIFCKDLVDLVVDAEEADLIHSWQGIGVASGVVWFHGICLDESCNSIETKVSRISLPPGCENNLSPKNEIDTELLGRIEGDYWVTKTLADELDAPSSRDVAEEPILRVSKEGFVWSSWEECDAARMSLSSDDIVNEEYSIPSSYAVRHQISCHNREHPKFTVSLGCRGRLSLVFDHFSDGCLGILRDGEYLILEDEEGS